jgi:hypothetical protein
MIVLSNHYAVPVREMRCYRYQVQPANVFWHLSFVRTWPMTPLAAMQQYTRSWGQPPGERGEAIRGIEAIDAARFPI